IIGCLIIKDGRVVQSIGFNKYLPIGRVDVAVEFLNKWGIDEIVLLDIDATRDGKEPDFKLVTEVSKKSFAPLTVGGGIKNIKDIKKLVYCGADKISINAIALKNPKIITEAAEIFGVQCIVVSMDVKKHKNHYEVYSDNGKKATGLDPITWAKKVEAMGAGEIFLNSIDRDGSKSGYEIKLIKAVSSAVSIPLIACGGAGHPKHFLEVFKKTGALAAAAGNFFQFTEHSPITVKSYLLKNKVDVRLDSHADYKDINFVNNGRIGKRADEYLRKLRFEYISDEII
ncbi:MAG: imidazole glycerol phosphate synthase cyclase subunit, partial [Patescibacteria group bacterium]